MIVLALGLAVVVIGIAVYLRGRKAAENAAKDAGAPFGVVPNYMDRPFTAMCTPACDLSTRKGVLDAFRAATHKEDVTPEEINRRAQAAKK